MPILTGTGDASPLDTFSLNRSTRGRSLSSIPFEASATEIRTNPLEPITFATSSSSTTNAGRPATNVNYDESSNDESLFRSNPSPSDSSSNQTSSNVRSDAPNRHHGGSSSGSGGSNPSMDDILSGLIQLIGGNVKLSNNNRQQSSATNHNGPGGLPFSVGLLPPQLAANPALLAQFASRLPNRLPNMQHFLPGQGPANMLPPNVLIGPSRVPLPLHFPPKNRNPPISNPHPTAPSPTTPISHLPIVNHHNPPANPSRPSANSGVAHLPHFPSGAGFPPFAHFSLPSGPQLNPSQLASLINGYGNSNNVLPIPFNELLAQANLNRTHPASALTPPLSTPSNTNNRIVKVEANEVSRLLGISQASSSALPASSSAGDHDTSNESSLAATPDNDFSVSNDPALQTSFGFVSTANRSPTSSLSTVGSTSLKLTPDTAPTVIVNHHRGVSLSARPMITTETNSKPSASDAENYHEASHNWQPFGHQQSSPTAATRPMLESSAPDIITRPEEPAVFDITVRHKLGHSSEDIQPTPTTTTIVASSTSSLSLERPIESSNSAPASEIIRPSETRPLSRTRTTSIPDAEVVYGRHVPTESSHTLSGPMISSTSTPAVYSSSTSTTPTPPLANNELHEITGRPYVVPVQVDQVRPAMTSDSDPHQQLLSQPGQGSVYIEGGQKHFKLKPVQRIPSIQVASAVNVLPASSSSSDASTADTPSSSSSSGAAVPSHTPPRAASSISRSRPAPPPVRIDTCIVGDDSTCGSAALERCRTEGGISSCHCRPGLGRASLRAPCVPATTLALQVRLDRLHGQKVAFSPHLLDPNSADFQKLESATAHALHTLISASRLARNLLTVRVRRFAPAAERALANVTVLMTRARDSNPSSMSVLRAQLASELARLVGAGRASALPLTLDSSVTPKVEDLDECADASLNDCSRYARCINELGGFSCVCRSGYEDRALVATSGSSPLLKQMRPGRVCSGCSTTHCSSRGECQVMDGQRVCKCRGDSVFSKSIFEFT